ncbi:MAG TPA: hypothetical protein DCS88_13170 [Alphaproteobacteria bacterium]|nr:hypothetical protein [Alphaproteobacteria bacterium]
MGGRADLHEPAENGAHRLRLGGVDCQFVLLDDIPERRVFTTKRPLLRLSPSWPNGPKVEGTTCPETTQGKHRRTQFGSRLWFWRTCLSG